MLKRFFQIFYWNQLLFKKESTPLDLDIQFKIADTDEEFKKSLEFLNDSNSIETHKIYLNKFMALPYYHLLIATQKNKIVGLSTLLLDNPLGLDIDESSNLSLLREKGLRVAETHGFRISLDLPVKNQLKVLQGLHQLMTKYCKGLHVDELILPSSLGINGLIKKILCYKLINTLNNTQFLSFNCSEDKVDKTSPKLNSSFSTYFLKAYTERSPLLDDLTMLDKLTLEKIYTHKSFRSLLPQKNSSLSDRRKHTRYPSACPCEVLSEGQSQFNGLVIDASLKGLSLIAKDYNLKSYKMAQKVQLQIKLPGSTVTLNGEIVWKSTSRSTIGVSLNSELPNEWIHYIESLDTFYSDSAHKIAV